jgi:hypothetical protein
MMLIVRTADAHAHLCFDGKEPPAVIHLADGGNHPCETDTSTEPNNDQDVQLAADLILKKASEVDSCLPALFRSVLLFVVPHAEERIPVVAHSVRVESLIDLRPPLRGPPA